MEGVQGEGLWGLGLNRESLGVSAMKESRLEIMCAATTSCRTRPARVLVKRLFEAWGTSILKSVYLGLSVRSSRFLLLLGNCGAMNVVGKAQW